MQWGLYSALLRVVKTDEFKFQNWGSASNRTVHFFSLSGVFKALMVGTFFNIHMASGLTGMRGPNFIAFSLRSDGTWNLERIVYSNCRKIRKIL